MAVRLSRKQFIIIGGIVLVTLVGIALISTIYKTRVAEFGILSSPIVAQNEYNYSKDMLYEVSQIANIDNDLRLNVYKVTKEKLEAEDYIRFLNVSPISIGNAANFYKNQETGVNLTYEKKLDSITIIPDDYAEMNFESITSNEEAISNCRSLINYLPDLSSENYVYDVVTEEPVYEIRAFQFIEDRKLIEETSGIGSVNCLINEAGETLQISLDLTQIKTGDSSLYPIVVLRNAAFNVLNNDWPWNMQELVFPNPDQTSYTIDAQYLQRFGENEVELVYVMNCTADEDDNEQCYAYPWYEITAEGEVSEEADGDIKYSAYFWVYLPALDPEYIDY